MTTKTSFLFINITLLLMFYLWNTYQPLTADDFGFVLKNAVSTHTLIQTIKLRYLNWDGRIIADLLAFTFLNQDSLKILLPIINLINSCVLLGVLHLIYKFLYQQIYNPQKFLLVSLLYIAFFTSIKIFSQIFLWKTVAIQYAWGFYVSLLIIWKFYSYYINQQQKFSKITIFVYLISGIAIGLYNEIYVAFFISLYLATITIFLINQYSLIKLLKAPYITFLCALSVSAIILIIAPGNYIRQKIILSDLHIQKHVYNIFLNLLMTYKQFFRYGYHVVIGIFLVYILYWICNNQYKIKPIHKNFLKFLLLLLNFHIISFIEVAYYAPISGRMLIFIDTIIFIIIYKFFQIKSHHLQINTKKLTVILINLLILIFGIISFAYYNLNKFITTQQTFIKNNEIQKLKLNEYNNLNKLTKYVAYFDLMRTSDKDFIQLYKK